MPPDMDLLYKITEGVEKDVQSYVNRLTVLLSYYSLESNDRTMDNILQVTRAFNQYLVKYLDFVKESAKK